MSDHVLVYITAKDLDEAKMISDTLVSEKLAACANILSGMESIYIWKGDQMCDKEVPFFLKTKKSLLQDMIKRVKELHSYDTPCIIALPILDGNPDYLKWLDENTK